VTALSAATHHSSLRQLGLLATIIAGLSTAFFFAPSLMAMLIAGASGITTGTLAHRVGGAFSEWWSAGTTSLTESMSAVVQFWAAFHAVKAVIAAALVVVLFVAIRQLLAAHAHEDSRGRRAVIAAFGIAASLAAPALLLVLLANVQGSIAPLSSVMGLLPMTPPTEALTEVRAHFAAGTTTPVLSALVDDFRRYHAAMAMAAVIATFCVVAVNIAVWIHVFDLPSTEKRARRTLATIAVTLPALALFLFAITLANASTVVETAPARASFFTNGQ
jgi:hypothetical protein